MTAKKIFNKSARMQGIIGMLILIISIMAVALYTGSQPGRKPIIN